jgi:methylenetetrahydrofolate dehydrogenase (NADP+) / methenyltetrahydrofolate cyclohydrolase
MSATVIDGRAVAQAVLAAVRDGVAAFAAEHGAAPGLATILVGDDPASEVYVRNKVRASEQVGIASHHHRLAPDTPAEAIAALIGDLNADAAVNGILLQRPVPGQADGGAALSGLIDADKDVDGLTLVSAGRLALGLPGLRPCTPLGCLELLDRHGVQLEGAEAVVVGRSDLVGKPVAQLLLGHNATVTMCHSRTRDLPAVCARADVLVAAVGRPRFVQGDWVREGAAVIDVGINRTADGVVGDVDFDAAARRAALITQVPGGVGPMTVAMLMRNTLEAARLQVSAPAGRTRAARPTPGGSG